MSHHSNTSNGFSHHIQDTNNSSSVKVTIPPGSDLSGAHQDEIPAFSKTLKEILEFAGTEPPLLLNPWLLQVGLVGLNGSSDTGKSCFARQLCVSIISGKNDFLGFPLNPQHRQAIYVTTEDDEASTGAAFKRLLKALPTENTEALRFVLDPEDLISKLDELLSRQPADLVVVDAYLDILEGSNSNDASVTRAILNKYKLLADRHKTLILFIHHTGKGRALAAPSKHNAIGSQSWEAKCRAVFELRTDEQNPLLKHFCIVKGNYISSEHKKESYQLLFDETTLSFSNTGERIPFSQLAIAPGEEKKTTAFRAENVSDEQHHEWLEKVFAGNPVLKYNELADKLVKESGHGKNKVTEGNGGLIPHYISQGFLRKKKHGYYEYTPPTPF